MRTIKTMPKEPVQLTSAAPLEETIAALRDLLPEIFSEGKVDYTKLREVLGDAVDDRTERYSFTWAGKRDAIRLLQVPSRATLAPAEEESVNFDETQHVFIEGENLEVLRLLYRAYFGQVKMIYIDPPYNTGNDFVYPDDFTDPLGKYLAMTGQRGVDGSLLTSNPETSGRYHSNWLSMMYPRLFVARQLLTQEGLIFISIDDHEAANLRLLMNEIFGEENFVAQLVWKGRQFLDSRTVTRVSTDHEYVLVYSRDSGVSFRGTERDESKFSNPDDDPRGPWMSRSILGLASKERRPNLHYSILDPDTGNDFAPPEDTGWRYSIERMKELIEDGCILFPPNPDGRPREKKFRKDLENEFTSFPSITAGVYTSHGTKEIRELFGFQAFDLPKPSELVRRLIEQGTGSDSIVLDFFAGSATIAQAVMQLNRQDGGKRRVICIQLPEPTDNPRYPTIADIGKERIRRVIAKLQSESAGQLDLKAGTEPQDLGMRVFKLAPSYFRPWEGIAHKEPGEYVQQMAAFTDTLVEGWSPEGVMWEVAVKEGYSLASRVTPVAGTTAHRVSDPETGQGFLICLDDTLSSETVAQFKLTAGDTFVCRDNALTDTLAANLALQCQLKTI